MAPNGDLGQLCFLVLIDVGNFSVTVPSLLFIDQFCYERGVHKQDILGRKGRDDVRP